MRQKVRRGRGLLEDGAVGTEVAEEDHRAAFPGQWHRERTDDVLVVALRVLDVVGDRAAVHGERAAVQQRQELP